MGSTLLVPALMVGISSNVFPKVQAVALPAAQEVNQRLPGSSFYYLENNQGPSWPRKQVRTSANKDILLLVNKAQTTLNQIKAKTPQLGKVLR